MPYRIRVERACLAWRARRRERRRREPHVAARSSSLFRSTPSALRWRAGARLESSLPTSFVESSFCTKAEFEASLQLSDDEHRAAESQAAAAKVAEEARELAEADDATREEEAGDLLFAAVNLVRAHGIAPEAALRAANDKFERRYRGMERLAEGDFASLDLDNQEALWQAVKRGEKNASA